jgi:DNA-binding PadR family transcriptional regulator
MRDQDLRRRGRHDAELAGCQRPGDEDRRDSDSEDESRRPRRGGHRGYARGGFPGGPPGFRGPGPWAGGLGPWADGPRRHGHRARRGDVRAAALALLAEQPVNGYQIIQEIGERSGGVWRPSPGSVYPVLQQLQDEGLIQAEPGETGHRAYVLTDSGREYAAAHSDELRAPWDVVAGGTGGAAIEMRTMMGQLAMAAFQVVGAGTAAQQAEARKILASSRKSLYGILADGEAEAGAGA